MAKVTYIAFLETSDDGFGVSFPDLDGCVSAGADQAEALENAREALSLHLEGMAQEGLEIPPPSDLTGIARKLADAYFEHREPVLYIGVEVEAPDAAERVNVYLNKGLLERMDRHARSEGLNRSEFVALASRYYMGEKSKGAANPRQQDADAPTFQRSIPMDMKPTRHG